MMGNVPRQRKRLLVALIVMLGIDFVAAVILLSPIGRSRQEDIRTLQTQLRAKTKQVEPLRGLDKKVVQAKQEIADFYRDRLPGEYSAVSESVGRLATQNGIKILQAKYTPEDLDIGGLRPVLIEAGLSGDYIHLMKFINALEREKTLFILDSVALGDSQGGTVKLQLKMETYLRSGA